MTSKGKTLDLLQIEQMNSKVARCLYLFKNKGNHFLGTDFAKATGIGDLPELLLTKSPGIFSGEEKKIYGFYLSEDEFRVKPGYNRFFAICPVLHMESTMDFIKDHFSYEEEGIKVIKYGFYPQEVASLSQSLELETYYQQNRLLKTGKQYVVDKVSSLDVYRPFKPLVLEEYQMNDDRFIRYHVNPSTLQVTLSNGKNYHLHDVAWFKVSPVTWLIDPNTSTIISQKSLLSGIQYNLHDDDVYSHSFQYTIMYQFLNTYLVHDLFDEVELDKNNNTLPNGNKIDRDLTFIKERLNLLKPFVLGHEDSLESIMERVSHVQATLQSEGYQKVKKG